jgi:hypothetical protein
MPFVRFHLPESVSDEYRDAICAATQAALVRSLGVPEQDLFQIVHRHREGDLRADPTWPGTLRREQVLFIEMLMSRGYDDATKAGMYTAVADGLEACGVRREDVFIAVTENGGGDWMAGTA